MKPEAAVIEKLKSLAVHAAENSYSPYSGFRVGAAVCSMDGAVYAGCNVENSSFGITQCAERSAITAAVSAGAKRGSLTCLVIYTPGRRVHSPCGACRQVMHELMAEDSVVISSCDTDETRAWSKSEYLPDAVTPESLFSDAPAGKTS